MEQDTTQQNKTQCTRGKRYVHNTLQRNTTLTHGLQDMYNTTQNTTTQYNTDTWTIG